MKKSAFYIAIIACLFSLFYSNPVHAQLFKRIMNTVENTTDKKVNDKAAQTINQVFDNIDSATKIKSNSNTTNTSEEQIDTSSINKVFGAFAKAAQENPNDTSAADVTMKALGLLTSGGGVSASDSAAAIKSFMTASGGSGVIYQFVTAITSKEMKNSKDTLNGCITNSGYARSEMNINMPGVSSSKIITINHAANPKYSVMLEPEDKTYSLNIIDTSLINDNQETYQVTKIGNENVQGYNCIHSKMISTFNTRFLKSSTTFDMWTSTEVPGYSIYQKLVSMQNVKPAMMHALEQAGVGGFFVKMTSATKDYSMEMVLVRAENKNLPASLFEIPSGYSESKENMLYHIGFCK